MRLLNLLNLRLPQSLAAILGTIGVLFATLLYLGWTTTVELERQAARPTDSALWALYQTSLEFYRLDNSYSRYSTYGGPDALKDFTQRFDIFYSRVKILNTGKALEPHRSEPFFRDGVRQLTDFVDRLAKLFDARDYTTLRFDNNLRLDFESFDANVAMFVTAAVQMQAAKEDIKRAELKQLLLFQLITSAAVLMAFLYFAVVVIKSRNQGLKREIELRESRDLLRATVKSSLDGVLIADAKGQIVDINDAAARIFGHEPAAMAGQEMSRMIMPERYRAAHHAGMARFLSTGEAKLLGRRIEIDAAAKDGREFPIELSITASGEGAATQFVAFMRDITERRMAEQNLKEARDRAEAASRAKAHFLAAMSHEMRTPLTGILGALDLIGGTELTEQQQKYIRTANRSGHALLSVISDVIDISRLEAGKMDIELNGFDLTEVAEDVIEILGNLAKQRRNELLLHFDNNLPMAFLGDAAKIRQVLLNLATNAVKFTYDGTVTIQARLLALSNSKAMVEIAVQDDGPGISEEERQQLFTSFSQLSSSPSGIEGSGLGLAISKRLVELMSGTIGVDTAPGAGSRFWFRLSLEAVAEEGVALVVEPSSIQQLPLAPRTVLVVDDNETVRSIVTGLLQSRGHQAEAAESAMMAMEMLKTASFDAIILDVSMPVMDGFEALRIIRSKPGRTGQTPVIALTAHALIEDRDRCIAAGFDHFLTKPVRIDELVAAIHAVTSAPVSPVIAPPAPAPAKLPVFELDGLKSQFGQVGSADLLRILQSYARELDQQLAILEEEGSEISPHHLRSIVHLLAGSSSMIGARRLAALTASLDAMASELQDTELSLALPELLEAIRETCSAVARTGEELAAAEA